MPTAPSTVAIAIAATSTTACGQNHHPVGPISLKHEVKPFCPQPTDMLDPSSSSTPGPIRVAGCEQDVALAKSEFLTRPEVLNRRARRLKQLARIYRDHYWALMEELKLKYREYYWEYGKSPFLEDENEKVNSTRADGAAENANNGNVGVNGGNVFSNPTNNRCGVHGCKTKAMALTRFCHMHILSDSKQKLYKACCFSIKSSTTGPILCGKPILRSTVPSYCPVHFQKAEKHMVRALKRAGLNITSTSKLAPKLHVLIAEYVRQIQQKRRATLKANLEKAVVKEEKC